MDSHGTVYTSYQSLFLPETRVTVRRWSPERGTWDMLGVEGDASVGTGWYNRLAFNELDQPLLLHRDYAFDGRANLRIFAGGHWNSYPTATPGEAHYTSLAISDGKVPIIAYQDRSASPADRTTVAYFRRATSAWVELPPPANDGPHAYQSIIVARGFPVVAFTSVADGGRARVFTLGPGGRDSWVRVGLPEGPTDPEAHNLTVAADETGRIYIAYHVWQERIVVKRFEDGSWVRLGALDASDGDTVTVETEHWRQWLSLDFDSQHRPYVAYQRADRLPVVRRFDEASDRWPAVGAAPFHDATADYLRMTLDDENRVWVAFTDGSQGGRWTVMRYTP